MKKSLSVILILSVMLTFLSGCFGKESEKKIAELEAALAESQKKMSDIEMSQNKQHKDIQDIKNLCIRFGDILDEFKKSASARQSHATPAPAANSKASAKKPSKSAKKSR